VDGDGAGPLISYKFSRYLIFDSVIKITTFNLFVIGIYERNKIDLVQFQ